jgi:hypothetical protein
MFATRIEQDLAAKRNAQAEIGATLPALAGSALDPHREETLAAIRRSIHAGEWKEASVLLDGFARDFVDDPQILPLHQEIQSARELALQNNSAQLTAARHVNDPERVLELHQIMTPLLEADARAALEADLSKWFLRLIHNRLRTGKIQNDVVILAGRIADAFSHTVEGASLRASLPTLRRSAGLCPRCAQPYTGLADACPACLGASIRPSQTPLAPSE